MVRVSPAVAVCRNGSAMIGTLPGGLTVTTRLPVVCALPSETVTVMVFSPLVVPPSE
jgi:hypothetical protein